jgi:2-haloacid dehalogenase
VCWLWGITEIQVGRSGVSRRQKHTVKQRGAGTQVAAPAWLVSSNPFDVIGAAACGWCTVWVKRNPTFIFDPWGLAPIAIISGLTELPALI